MTNTNTNTSQTAPSTRTDAISRAVRTFVAGLLASVILAVGPVIAAASGEVRWTAVWWEALGASVATAAVSAGLSYLGRYKLPPK